MGDPPLRKSLSACPPSLGSRDGARCFVLASLRGGWQVGDARNESLSCPRRAIGSKGNVLDGRGGQANRIVTVTHDGDGDGGVRSLQEGKTG